MRTSAIEWNLGADTTNHAKERTADALVKRFWMYRF